MPNSSGETRKRDTSRKRNSILTAAIEEFRARGYDGASMDRIADAAGASKRTVYNHYPSKQELFRTVFDEYVSSMQAAKRIAYSESRSLEEQLSDFIDAEIALVSDPAWTGFLNVILSVFMRVPDFAREAAERHTGAEDHLEEWMRAAAKAGRLAIEDPALAARIFAAMVGGAYTWPAVYQGAPAQAAAEPLKSELILTFLARYRR